MPFPLGLFHNAAHAQTASRPHRPMAPAHDAPVVWITGGSRGIGRAVAYAFARAGWRVAIQYRARTADAEETARAIQAEGGNVHLAQVDVRDGAGMAQLATDIVARWGRLTVAIANAGIAPSHLVLKTDSATWDETLAVNLTGAFHTLRAAGTHMVAQGDGHILVVGSRAGAQGAVGQAAYAATKAGLVALARSAALDWGHANVRVNVVWPGWQATELAGTALPQDLSLTHALGRTAALEEVARSIVYFAGCRDASGQVWNLDSRIP